MTDVLAELEGAAGRVAERVGAATVAIGRSPRGSGLVVAPGRVLTNAHNLRDRTTQVTFADGRAAQSTVLAVDAGSDLAVLDVDTAEVDPLEWADRVPGVGAAVFSLARGVRGVRLSVGFVSGVDRTFRGPGGRPIGGGLEHTAPMGRGSSGGPLVDTTGAVVGVNTHRLGEGFYLALAADPTLVERVRSLVAGRSPRRPTLGIAVAPAEVARRLRRSVGLDERDGVLVRGVEEPGPAAAADLRVGDLIVRAGSVPTPTIDALHGVLGAHDVSEPLTVEVVRGVEELTLTVSFVEAERSDEGEGDSQADRSAEGDTGA
jgi:S1-C subfamily serine protease